MKRNVKGFMALAIAGGLAISGLGGIPSVEASDGKTVINFYYWDEGQKEGMDELISMLFFYTPDSFHWYILLYFSMNA